MDELDLARLEDTSTPVAAIPDLIAAVSAGARAAIRIDITDPPSLPVASIGGIDATGETADEAMKELAPLAAARARLIEAAKPEVAVEEQ